MSRPEYLKEKIASIVDAIAGKPLDTGLQNWLNNEFGFHHPHVQAIKQTCMDGVKDGWLCQREGGGIRYGRIFKASDDLSGFSVDVVDMQNIAGPHHAHPLGEIDLIMPIDEAAQFDNHQQGWLVYPPGSEHAPTVTQGRALILYLLPQGKIDFSR